MATQETLKTRYKFIHFARGAAVEGKPSWFCVNTKSRDDLGVVFWYRPWRQYCFTTDNEDAVFSADCLADIQNFIGQLGRP